jgi:hypothetical protein
MSAVEIIEAPVKTAKFFTFTQNNSGGAFIRNDDVSHFVIIEAFSSEEADSKAEKIGVYFDGCNTGRDCNCCGDRWSRAYEGEDVPLIYGQLPETYNDIFCKNKSDSYCVIYFLDDGKKIFRGRAKV